MKLLSDERRCIIFSHLLPEELLSLLVDSDKEESGKPQWSEWLESLALIQSSRFAVVAAVYCEAFA